MEELSDYFVTTKGSEDLIGASISWCLGVDVREVSGMLAERRGVSIDEAREEIRERLAERAPEFVFLLVSELLGEAEDEGTEPAIVAQGAVSKDFLALLRAKLEKDRNLRRD